MGLALFAAMPVFAQQKATINVHPEQGKEIISKHIYGQFAEHLGTCIYGGLWVGEDSKIPNTQGYRNDVLQALKDLKVPVLRWPGGCFADEYHWMDGIGPKENRPRMVNNNWGGTVEDNSFGTHEFLNLCELIGCEPYISGNVGSGSVEDPIVVTILQFGFCALFAWIATFALEGVHMTWDRRALGGVLYLALFCTMLALLLQNVGQKYASPASASILMSTESVFGILFSVLFAGEVVTPRLAVGFALIFAAVLVSEVQLPAKQAAKQ